MNVKWLFEKDVFGENLDAFVAEVRRQGMEAKVAYHAPFDDDATFLKLFSPDDCVVFYGSLNMGQRVQQKARWVPGVYLNLPQLECLYYYPRLGRHLLNSTYAMVPYGDLLRQKKFLFNSLGNNDCLFVRPNASLKSFTGQVASRDEWEKKVEYMGFYDVEPEQLVVVSEPRNLTREWRLVVVDNNVITGCLYKEGGRLVDGPVEQRVVDRAAAVLADVQYQPTRAWTLDMCETRDGDLHVLEVGSFICAGLYTCLKELIVREVSGVAWRQYCEAREPSLSP
jgi:ATP-grasp domain, R2K clade family 3